MSPDTERTIAELRTRATRNRDWSLMYQAADLLGAKQSWIDGAKVDLADLDDVRAEWDRLREEVATVHRMLGDVPDIADMGGSWAGRVLGEWRDMRAERESLRIEVRELSAQRGDWQGMARIEVGERLGQLRNQRDETLGLIAEARAERDAERVRTGDVILRLGVENEHLRAEVTRLRAERVTARAQVDAVIALCGEATDKCPHGGPDCHCDCLSVFVVLAAIASAGQS